jgi:hypothetical protein
VHALILLSEGANDIHGITLCFSIASDRSELCCSRHGDEERSVPGVERMWLHETEFGSV